MTSPVIVQFLIIVGITLGITFWAARRASGRDTLYAASGQISSVQNGFAIAGDFMSAGTILGLVGLYGLGGIDIAYYVLTGLAGFALMLALLAAPLRRLGRFTLGDVLASRLPDRRLRIVVGLCTVTISIIYLVAQLVGAGALISIVFNVSFIAAVMSIGILMTMFVVFGGMLATTWVQIIKSVILLGSVVLLAILCLRHAGGIGPLYDQIGLQPGGTEKFVFGSMQLGLFSAISIGISQTLGHMGMPHLLIRFFTVPDPRAARRSLLLAICLISVGLLTIVMIIAPAGFAYIYGNQAFHGADGQILGGSNMVTMHLSRLMGGEFLFGLMSAVAFSTILAVVAGINVSIASAVAHDLFASLRQSTAKTEKGEILVFRVTSIIAALLGIILAVAFEGRNLTFLAVMGSSVAASTTCPLLLLTIYWKGLNLTGAIACGITGLVSSLCLIILSPAVWTHVFGYAEPIFPSEYPTLISVPLAFLAAWLGSKLSGSASILPVRVT